MHVMRYPVSEDITPLILNLDTTWGEWLYSRSIYIKLQTYLTKNIFIVFISLCKVTYLQNRRMDIL